jgi:predicted ATPase
VAEDGDARQFILETHSESMLLRLQKRIRNGDISGDDVAVLFMESVSPEDSDDGQGFNKVTELKIDHLGDVIDPFPVSFVDLRIRDLF